MFSSLIVSMTAGAIAGAAANSKNTDFSEKKVQQALIEKEVQPDSIKKDGFFDEYGFIIFVLIECLILSAPFAALSYFLLKLFFKLHGL